MRLQTVDSALHLVGPCILARATRVHPDNKCRPSLGRCLHTCHRHLLDRFRSPRYSSNSLFLAVAGLLDPSPMNTGVLLSHLAHAAPMQLLCGSIAAWCTHWLPICCSSRSFAAPSVQVLWLPELCCSIGAPPGSLIYMQLH